MDEQPQRARWALSSPSGWAICAWSRAASVLFACSLFACEEGHPPLLNDRSVSPPASWCSAMCAAYRRCEGNARSSCLNDCQAGNRAFLARNSDASLELQTECLELATCTPEFDDLLDECFSEAFSALEPSTEAVELCATLAKPFFECSWFSTPQSCGRFHAVYSAPALAAERACAAASCEELEGCVEAQLYSFGE